MNDFENDLREMLRTRASDVDHSAAAAAERIALAVGADAGPAADRHTSHSLGTVTTLHPDAAPAGHRRPGRGLHAGWLVAAAVIAVLALAGGLLALTRDGGKTRPTPPAKPVPVRTSTVTECLTALPQAWRTAANASLTATDLPLDVGPDGTVLVDRDLGTSRQLVGVSTSGTQTVLVDLPDSRHLEPMVATVDGNHVVVGLYRSVRNSNGAMPVLRLIEVLDRTTGRLVKTITVTTEADYRGGLRSSDTVAALDGHVYWDERSRYDAAKGVVRDYDIATGRTSTVYSGTKVRVRASAGGISWWTPDTVSTAPVRISATGVPAAVLAATTPLSRVSMTTDGTNWSWYDDVRQRIGHFDGTSVRYVRGKQLPTTQDTRGVSTVVGPYVFFTDQTNGLSSVVDTRSGATTSYPDAVRLTAGGGAIAAGYRQTDKFATRLVRLNTASLPALHC